MNQGKICVSICADTVSKFIENINKARGQGDLIELRFDCLRKDELNAEDVESLRNTLAKIVGGESYPPWITTFRPKSQGGERELSDFERRNFWNVGSETEIADLEEDMVDDSWSWLWSERICSFHSFAGVPDDIESIFRRLVQTQADIIKIAVNVGDATEAIEVWKLLDNSSVRVIPIAMSEPGKWTRILGLAHGAPITYASLDEGAETAPGQISARDLRDVFRVKELNRETEVYGVIAGNTSYSLSPYMHNATFKQAARNSVFIPLQVEDLDKFIRRMVKPATREVELNFRGFSVTNPHKQAIVRHLDVIDETAQKIGAVNTVKVEDGKLHGYNTDAPGFIGPLKELYGDLKDVRVAVAGAGGAARACIYALQQEGANVTLLVRDVAKASALVNGFEIKVEQLTTDNRPLSTDILVNATPLGTRGPGENDTIATADELLDVKLVYDLVYNPAETRLLREAKAAGAKTLGGIDMLIAQGAEQFLIWTGTKAPLDIMKAAITERLSKTNAG
ncbi:MAG TPA: shikimate dehydrogenase [Pyrinomonadaceae bacterium]|nr:shikimate dehydrogenase [Pyrinomonadaceae bacterium]